MTTKNEFETLTGCMERVCVCHDPGAWTNGGYSNGCSMCGCHRPANRTAKAVNICCATKHAITFHPLPDAGIIPAVKASIAYCEEVGHKFGAHAQVKGCRLCRFAAAADKLRDFATVELLCEGLGITRRDLN